MNLVGVCSRWCPVVQNLHRFFVAIARAVVNHDDGSGTAPDPLVWSAGSLPTRRRVVDAVRNFAFLPGPVDIWCGDWVSFGVSGTTVEDVRVWPYSVSLLVKNVGLFGQSCIGKLALLILVLGMFHLLRCSYCMSYGLVRDFVLKVLFLGIGGLDVQFQCRLFLLVQALIFGVPVGFWVPSFVLYVCCLVALGGFSLGILGLIMVVFDMLVGKKCCHGLTSRPREISSVWFLNELLFLFWVSCCLWSWSACWDPAS